MNTNDQEQWGYTQITYTREQVKACEKLLDAVGGDEVDAAQAMLRAKEFEGQSLDAVLRMLKAVIHTRLALRHLGGVVVWMAKDYEQSVAKHRDKLSSANTKNETLTLP